MPETMRFAVYPTPELAIRAAADLFTALAPQTVALAGGNTPKELYGLLASDDYRDRTDWHELEIYYGDERAVPPNHPDSNYGMSRRALLDLVPIQPDSVYRMEADDADLDAAADRYAQLLPQHLDLVLLGLGTDGHTASLFPGDEACDEQERRSVPATAPNGSRRMTLTYPTLNAARHVTFLVLGADKRDALRTIRGGAQLPAARVAPARGDVTWIVDAAAYGDA
jgi:6-phosphogluconolactonase